MAIISNIVLGLFLFVHGLSCNVLDEKQCSKFEYEYKILERIIFLENKNTELERKQVLVERKIEELMEIEKEQRLVMEQKDTELENKDKEIEQRHTELVQNVDKINKNHTEERLVLESKITSKNDAQDAAREDMKRNLELEDRSLGRKIEDFGQAHDEILTRISEMSKGPKEVGFTARFRPPSHQTYAKGSTIIFNSVVSNVGGNYNSQTGIFTSPVDGLYMFAITIFTYGRYVHVKLMKNTTEIAGVYPDGHHGGSSYDSATSTAVVSLRSGDKVFATFANTGGSWSYNMHTYGWSTFSGVLVY